MSIFAIFEIGYLVFNFIVESLCIYNYKHAWILRIDVFVNINISKHFDRK